MKFKLVEKFDETRDMVQEYMYDAIDELNNASLEEYIQWFKNLNYYDEYVEQAVTDAYIEACDYGMIKGVEKTRVTSELKEYIESHTDIIDDTDELMKQCPGHLQHELKIVLSKLDESLNEELLTEDSFNDFSQNHKFIYEARFKTETGELELFTDDFNKFSNMIYKYYLNNTEIPIIIHVLELTLDCENNFNFPNSDFVFIDDNQLHVQKISYQIHSHKELNKVVHPKYRRTSEQNKLSDDTLSKENRLLYFWSKYHKTKQQIQELNKDFLYIEFS